MEILKEWWGVFVGAVGFVVWLVRLEAGMLANRKDIRRIEKQRENDIERTETQRGEVKESLNTIQGDIKQILILMNTKEDRR